MHTKTCVNVSPFPSVSCQNTLLCLFSPPHTTITHIFLFPCSITVFRPQTSPSLDNLPLLSYTLHTTLHLFFALHGRLQPNYPKKWYVTFSNAITSFLCVPIHLLPLPDTNQDLSIDKDSRSTSSRIPRLATELLQQLLSPRLSFAAATLSPRHLRSCAAASAYLHVAAAPAFRPTQPWGKGG